MKLKRFNFVFLLLFFVFFKSEQLLASQPQNYTLLDPKPRNQMRALNTDRPTKAPNPYTIDAGHFLMEMDVVTYTRATSVGSPTTETFSFVAPTIKLGILDWTEIQVTPPSYALQNFSTGGFQMGRINGFGDTIIRNKTNFYGNMGGNVSLAIMPYVKIPNTSSNFSNGVVEGGVTLPGSVTLSDDWGLGFMAQWDYKKNSSDSAYHSEGQGSAYLSYSIINGLNTYLEIYGRKSFELNSLWISTVDTGLVYKVTPDTQIDAGLNIGLTDASDNLNPFLGFSFRI